MFNLSFALDYLKHRITAKTRHGVHSPFVYQLVDQVIYDFKPVDDYKAIELCRKELLKSAEVITVTDLGAGSQFGAERSKSVAQIAKNALKSPALAQLLYRLAKNQQAKCIIELGTCLGITTAYLAKSSPDAQVVTVEGCPQTAQVAAGNFAHLGMENITLKVGNFDQILPEILQEEGELDFVYVDGNHRKDATLQYFHWLLPLVNENTLLIFDDIYWSKGMKEAWDEIKSHPQVTVTIDLFWIGLVFFKAAQAKEDFKIKF